MQAKAKEAQADARIEYGKQLDEMRKMRDEAQAKMRSPVASDDAWTTCEALSDQPGRLGLPRDVSPDDEPGSIVEAFRICCVTPASDPPSRPAARGRGRARPE